MLDLRVLVGYFLKGTLSNIDQRKPTAPRGVRHPAKNKIYQRLPAVRAIKHDQRWVDGSYRYDRPCTIEGILSPNQVSQPKMSNLDCVDSPEDVVEMIQELYDSYCCKSNCVKTLHHLHIHQSAGERTLTQHFTNAVEEPLSSTFQSVEQTPTVAGNLSPTPNNKAYKGFQMRRIVRDASTAYSVDNLTSATYVASISRDIEEPATLAYDADTVTAVSITVLCVHYERWNSRIWTAEPRLLDYTDSNMEKTSLRSARSAKGFKYSFLGKHTFLVSDKEIFPATVLIGYDVMTALDEQGKSGTAHFAYFNGRVTLCSRFKENQRHRRSKRSDTGKHHSQSSHENSRNKDQLLLLRPPDNGDITFMDTITSPGNMTVRITYVSKNTYTKLLKKLNLQRCAIDNAEQKELREDILDNPSGFLNDDVNIGMFPGSKSNRHSRRPALPRPRIHRIPLVKRDEVERQIQELQAQGAIELSLTTFTSPFVLIENMESTWRFTEDYRLNAVTKKQVYLIPVDFTAGTKYNFEKKADRIPNPS
ncbi:unnamed protein product [Caenorhabditis auriculariae]|uniref:Uncharacterized protein n=1 Tax=Caenorhabditis auriculariae TaxID=2777116 RepID=A0A8S1HEL7_9PELO|nr:unnamed protein product [Caenorhabditis auriculariae]